MSDRDSARGVSGHYAPDDVDSTLRAILDALRADGKDLDTLTTDDLAPADQFHSRGKPATLELARLAGLRGGERVLDVGGGVGGPARTLAAEFGCTVTVLDLTEAYCRAGERLTELTRLTDRVSFRQGSAYEMPFEDASFDVAWTQHSSMNMEDKERLYAEIRRVLRPGGTLALHEIMAGPVQPIRFPVPWAADPSISFLRPPDEIRAVLRRLGFVEKAWLDTTPQSLDWFRERTAAAAASPSPPPLGLHLLLGPRIGPAIQSVYRNLQEQRLVIVEAIFEP
jgi:ubiquinone/menaquinone biosynthesis C-methylase UbiE